MTRERPDVKTTVRWSVITYVLTGQLRYRSICGVKTWGAAAHWIAMGKGVDIRDESCQNILNLCTEYSVLQ